jgi:hypothetical protein
VRQEIRQTVLKLVVKVRFQEDMPPPQLTDRQSALYPDLQTLPKWHVTGVTQKSFVVTLFDMHHAHVVSRVV